MTALILVRGEQKENALGRYTGEIMRAEGLNWYQIQDFQGQSTEDLAHFGLVILTHCVVNLAEIQTLLSYVKQGGHLLSFRPCVRLAEALGLKATNRAQKGGYLSLDCCHAAVQGLYKGPIQFHGVSEHWNLPDETSLQAIASLSRERTAPPAAPGVIIGALGSGTVAVFAYDLPTTVAAIRQGDPDRADTLSAGLDGIYRPSEMFVGHLDPDCALVPQADIHTGLLMSVMDWLVGHPLPRLWYYPHPEQRSTLIMTSDGDWSQIGEFKELMAAVEEREGRITFYLVPGTRVSPDLASAWAKRGHVFSVHPDFAALSGAAQPHTDYGIDEQYWHQGEMLAASVRGHAERFGVQARTTRHHCARWTGYVVAARILGELGIEMDFNYVSIAPFSATYMIGSGRPLKFVDLDGSIIDVFQQSTLYSEDCILAAFVFSLKWSTERALAHVERMLATNLDSFYTPIGLNSHPVSFVGYSRAFVEGYLDMIRERDIPVVTGEEWLDFTQARYRTELLDVEWDPPSLSFTVRTEGAPTERTVMWPLNERRISQVRVNGRPRDVIVEELWERRFALLQLTGPELEQRVQVRFG